ncbi:MAG: dihydroneopterin aldolase [Verrucomicrobiota bacterium]|nr:dihydroneopterin aldolase [Verrucomicrobiota bacterium]
MADGIHIEQLELSACIGVPDEERRVAQRLTLNLTLEPQRDFSALNDRLENTVDYSVLTRFVQEFARSRPRKLVETLAEEIALAVLARFPLRAIELELRKFVLPDACFVAVRLRRERGAQPPASRAE